jgi:hypothetical protein
MDIKVMDDNPLYKGEVYRLKFRFGNNYPIGTDSKPGQRYSTYQLLTRGMLQKLLR